MDKGIADLKDKGFVSLPYPPELRRAVERAVESWKAFCVLPKEVRLRFPYDPGKGMGVGYEHKETAKTTFDVKEDFHVTLAARDWLLKTARNCNDSTILRFVNDAEALIEIMRPTVEEFARSIEEEFELVGFRPDITGNSDWWFIRFLHYFGNRKEGEEIASSHVDKSAFTLHLYESHPGLERLTREGDWKPMPVSEGETAIIPGMRLQYRSENCIKATCHRVVATETTAAEGRFSAVCFVHPRNTPEYDKQSAGRLQEFGPGFNYTMPWDEFSKLFK